MTHDHRYWLGYFPDFKGGDSILLECSTPSDVLQLSALLAALRASEKPSLPVHVLARVAPAHQVRLFATQVADLSEPGFQWLCTPATLPRIREALHSLAAAGIGHQYFDLTSTSVQLVVACREYGRDWWLSQG